MIGTITSQLPYAVANGSGYKFSASGPFKLLGVGIWVLYSGSNSISGNFKVPGQFGIPGLPAYKPFNLRVLMISGQQAGTGPISGVASGSPDYDLLFPGGSGFVFLVNSGIYYAPGGFGVDAFAVDGTKPATMFVEWVSKK